jgi:hypothetical protein
MSIASKEAQDRYPVGGYGGVSVESIIMDNDNGILQKAYVAGRTAEPTEAEIEAGAMAIFRTLITSAHPMSDSDYAEAWNCIATMQKDRFKRQSQAVLEAARKAVTE